MRGTDRQLMLVGDMLRLNAVADPHKTALICGGERLSYDELNRLANRMAHALRRAGVSSGDRVGVLGYNTREYFCLYFAVAKLGAIFLPLNYWYRVDEHRHVLDDSKPAMVFCQPQFRQIMIEAIADRPIALNAFPGPEEQRCDEWSAFLDGAQDEEPDVEIGPEAPHLIIYTSGTTGRPKGAVLSHARTVLDALSMSGALGVRQDDIFINAFPPFHVGNWDHQKLYVIAGATVVLLPQFDAAQLLKMIAQERVSVLLTVPTMLSALISYDDFARTDTSSIRLLYYGAYDPSGVIDRAADLFGARDGKVELAHCYGLTEGGPFVTLCRSQDIFENWGSIGRAVPGVEVALLDDDGRRVAQGTHGEICFRGPRMSGYWGNEAATAETIRDGWLHTGDVGVMNERGFLWIVDRKKDMIRSGGHNIYSKEVEDIVAQHPSVAEVAIIGLDDPVYEEMVCAVIVVRAGFAPDEALSDDIRKYVRDRKAGYNVPKRIEYLPELPKNAVGKTQKHVLRDLIRTR